MIEFNLFLIDYWYFSFPLFLTIILWSRHEMNRGGNKITSADLTRLVNKNSATVIDLRSADEFNIGHSIISRSLTTGLVESVQKMKSLLNE